MRALGHMAVALGLAVLGCGPQFDPPSEIHGLRVLAVRPEPASGAPGETVTLKMLIADPRIVGNTSGELPKLDILWLAGCHNPPGRQYFACLPALRSIFERAATDPEARAFLAANSHEGSETDTEFPFTLPEDILSSAPILPHDPLHYGVSYVFFAACTGKVELRPDITDRIPIGCRQGNQEVGPAGLVLGFATYYTYEGELNQSPIFTSFDFDGESVTVPADGPALTAADGSATCTTDADCGDGYPHERVCAADTQTCAFKLPACAENCSEHRVLPHMDTASVEPFSGGNEVIWASYYATSGELSSPSRLFVDRNSGLTSDPSTKWTPPGSAQTARLWITINDQRGGAAWTYFDVAAR